MTLVREPAVAGMFYPADPTTLAAEVNTLLTSVSVSTDKAPKAIIAPHAGYIYSGPIAASAYSRVKNIARNIRRVVLLGPSHRVALRGLALPGVESFATPLGNITIDREAVEQLQPLPQVQELAAAHRWEHSLEVQLPFLQTLFDNFTLIPLVVGNATSTEVAEALNLVWGNDETLVVISSDLSHYLPYQTACEVDRATADAIVELQGPLKLDEACGGIPINGLIEAARHRHLTAELIDLGNSGDTAGDKNRVVGYGAFGFYDRY